MNPKSEHDESSLPEFGEPRASDFKANAEPMMCWTQLLREVAPAVQPDGDAGGRTTDPMGTSSPRRAIELLDELESLGFATPAFRILHHFGDRGEKIHSFRSYCERVQEFREGTNSDVVRRLELVLAMYRGAGLTVMSESAFLNLARVAVEQVPFGTSATS